MMQAFDEKLFLEFVAALNGELVALKTGVRIARQRPAGDSITLLDEAGRPLGNLPDHADAPTIAAFERILRTVREGRAE